MLAGRLFKAFCSFLFCQENLENQTEYSSSAGFPYFYNFSSVLEYFFMNPGHIIERIEP
jgi:hypothetical protein